MQLMDGQQIAAASESACRLLAATSKKTKDSAPYKCQGIPRLSSTLLFYTWTLIKHLLWLSLSLPIVSSRASVSTGDLHSSMIIHKSWTHLLVGVPLGACKAHRRQPRLPRLHRSGGGGVVAGAGDGGALDVRGVVEAGHAPDFGGRHARLGAQLGQHAHHRACVVRTRTCARSLSAYDPLSMRL